jgi:hypothetical protein
MKKIQYFLCVLFAAALLAGCDNDDDGFYNEKYINAANLVSIDIQPSYTVGGYLFVKADFSNIIAEAGQVTPLDIYQTTHGATGFVFTYTLEKQIDGTTWAPVTIETSQLNVIKGSAQSGAFVLAKALYNASDLTYEYNVGLPLLAVGQYRLSFGVNSDSNTEIELRSDTQGNNLFLNIISTTAQLDSAGYYTFSVQ